MKLQCSSAVMAESYYVLEEEIIRGVMAEEHPVRKGFGGKSRQ